MLIMSSVLARENGTSSVLSTRRLRVLFRKHPRLQARAPTASSRRLIDLADRTREPETLARFTPDLLLALEDAVTATEVAAARARSLAEALVSLPMEDGIPVRPVSPHTSIPDALLSPREREVLALVAAGQTNKAIAMELFVSPHTVKRHVTSLLHKLHVDTRVQLAATATRQGLH